MSLSKFKANVIINNTKIKCLFEITAHFLKIGIADKKQGIQSEFEIIKALFISMNFSKTFEYYINYVFINNIKSDLENILLEINNPIVGNIVSLRLNDLEGMSFLFKKKIDIHLKYNKSNNNPNKEKNKRGNKIFNIWL